MTTKQASKKIKEAGGSWVDFQEWMVGQTMGLNPDGSTDYYEYDVNRFISYKCDSKNEPLEDWD